MSDTSKDSDQNRFSIRKEETGKIGSEKCSSRSKSQIAGVKKGHERGGRIYPMTSIPAVGD